MLHLNPSELHLPFIRFLLKWSFNTGGKPKLNALLQELQGYYDTIERIIPPGPCQGERTLPHCPQPRDSRLLPGPHAGSSISQLVLDSRPIPRKHDDNANVSPATLASELLSTTPPISQPGTDAHFPNYSSRDRSNHQASPTMYRPTSISYTRASTPAPSNTRNIASTSWFGSTRSYRSRERDDNCSGPLHREYSSGSSHD